MGRDVLGAWCLPLLAVVHSNLRSRLVLTELPPPEPIHAFRLDDVVCREAPGDLFKHYERKAA
jgi:hypothetical protein